MEEGITSDDRRNEMGAQMERETAAAAGAAELGPIDVAEAAC